MSNQPVAKRVPRCLSGVRGAPLLALLLFAGCGEEAAKTAERQTAPVVSLSVPVLEEAPADMHALVPADTALFVQAVSLEALKDATNAYVRLIDPRSVTNDPREWLAGLGLFDPSRVDYERPCALALSAATGDFPMTLILASSDAGALSRTAAPGLAVATRGDYVSFSPSGDPGPLGSPLTLDLPVGTIAGRIDLPPLFEAGRTAMEVGLGLMQMQVASQQVPTGMDMQAMLAAVAKMARGFMAAAERLEFSVGQDGREISLNGVLSVKAGSPLGGFPPQEGGNLGDLASRLDPDAAVLMLMRGNIEELSDRSRDIMRMVISAYFPAHDTGMDLDEMMGGWSALYRLGRGTFAGTFSFDQKAMGWNILESSNPAAFVNTYTQLVEEGLLNSPFGQVAFESAATVDGVPVTTFRTTVDLEQLYGAQLDPRMRDQMTKTMNVLNGGEGSVLTHLLHAEDRVGMIIGARESSVDAASLAALSGPPGELRPAIAELVDLLDAHDAGFAMRFDVLAYMRVIAAMVDATQFERAPGAFDGGARITVTAAVTGNEWDLGGSVDLGGLLRAISAAGRTGR